MSAPEPAPVPDAATLEAVDRWVAFRLWHTRTPGAQVALGVAGVPFFSRAYGWADLEGDVAMTTGHLFRIASHSKTFTATLVLQLVEQGRLGLEDPLSTHVPALADDPLGGVVVRELLEHTAGVLRDGRDADYWQADRPFPDVDALLAMAREGGLKTAPGERFAYSNVGYSLLGLVVEAVTGETFADAARHGITEPLGLADTVADHWAERAGDYAAGHTGLHTAARRRAVPHVGTGAMAAATGFTSTADDLVTYFGAHVLGDDRLLADRTKRLQQRLVSAGDPRADDGSGYGWGMVREKVGEQVFVGHSGGYPGHITKTLVDPRSGLTISVLTNAIDGPATPLARGIAQILAAAAEAGGEPTAVRPRLDRPLRQRLGRAGRRGRRRPAAQPRLHGVGAAGGPRRAGRGRRPAAHRRGGGLRLRRRARHPRRQRDPLRRDDVRPAARPAGRTRPPAGRRLVPDAQRSPSGGVFGISSTAAVSTTATAAVPRKTACSAGSSAEAGMPAAVVDTVPPPLRASEALATAPKTAIPTALPIERANMLVPVTTPRTAHSAAAWPAISVGLAVRPMPRPMTKQVPATAHTELPGLISTSRATPTRMIAQPARAVSRKPIRR